jgi:hypothetical protein
MPGLHAASLLPAGVNLADRAAHDSARGRDRAARSRAGRQRHLFEKRRLTPQDKTASLCDIAGLGQSDVFHGIVDALIDEIEKRFATLDMGDLRRNGQGWG